MRSDVCRGGHCNEQTMRLAFEVNVVFVGNGKYVVALVRLDGFYEVAFGVLEMNLDPGQASTEVNTSRG